MSRALLTFIVAAARVTGPAKRTSHVQVLHVRLDEER